MKRTASIRVLPKCSFLGIVLKKERIIAHVGIRVKNWHIDWKTGIG